MRGGFFNGGGGGSRPAASSSSRPQTARHPTSAGLLSLEDMPMEVRAALLDAARCLAFENNADPSILLDDLSRISGVGPGPSMPSLERSLEPPLPILGVPASKLKSLLSTLDGVQPDSVKKKCMQLLKPKWFSLLEKVKGEARRLREVVDRLVSTGIQSVQDTQEISRALKELQRDLLQCMCRRVNGKETVLGSMDRSLNLISLVVFYVPQKLREEVALHETLITAAEKRLTQGDRSASAALMCIASHIFDPHAKLYEGHAGLDGKKMVLYPKNLLLAAANEHLLALAFTLFKEDAASPSVSIEIGDNRPGSYAFVEAIGICEEFKIPAQIQLCRSLITPHVREAIGACLLTRNYRILGAVLHIIKRALGGPPLISNDETELFFKNTSLWSKWPRMMPEFVKEEWMCSLIPTMDFLRAEITVPDDDSDCELVPRPTLCQAFTLVTDVLQILNAATNNHAGAFGFQPAEDASSQQNDMPYDPVPWPPKLIKAHASLCFETLASSPSIFSIVAPSLRPYARTPLALNTSPPVLYLCALRLVLRNFVPHQLMNKKYVDGLEVMLCASRHAPETRCNALKKELTLASSNFSGFDNFFSHETPTPILWTAQFILPWAEAMLTRESGFGMKSAEVEDDRWQQWGKHLDGYAPGKPMALFKMAVKEYVQWQEQSRYNKSAVIKGIAQLLGFLALASPSKDMQSNLLFIRVMQSREKACQHLRSHPPVQQVVQEVQHVLPAVKAACTAHNVKLPAYVLSSTPSEEREQEGGASWPASAAADGAANAAPSASSRPAPAAAAGVAKAAGPSRPVSAAADDAANASSSDGAANASASAPGPGPRDQCQPHASATHAPVLPTRPGKSASKGQLRKCLGCHKEGYNFKKCSVCNGRFCSVECQRAAWPEHKKVCKPPAQ